MKADDGRISLYVDRRSDRVDRRLRPGPGGPQRRRSAFPSTPNPANRSRPRSAWRTKARRRSPTRWPCAGQTASTAASDEINETLAPARMSRKRLTLTPKAGTGKGAYQLSVEGTVGGRTVKKTKGFIARHSPRGAQTIHPASMATRPLGTPPRSPRKWPTPRSRSCSARTPGAGRPILSAKMRLAWAENYVLSILVEVTDDKLVTNRRRDKPSRVRQRAVVRRRPHALETLPERVRRRRVSSS